MIIKPEYDWQGHTSMNPIRRYWKNKIARRVLSMTESNKRTLDIGCGSSKLITHYSDIIGIDIDRNKIEYLASKGINKLYVMNANKLEYEDNSFEQVFCIEVLEHIENAFSALREISRVLKPKGIAVIATPDFDKRLWRVIQPLYDVFGGYKEDHVTHFTKELLINMAKEVALELLHYEYIATCDLLCVFTKETE